jgi:hypothetical protein
MNEQTVEISHKTQDLLGVLERDIEHIGRTVSYLNELRGLVIKRDEKGMCRLLDVIRTESQEYAGNEQRRNLMRKEMAEVLGCRPEELTLTFLKKGASGQALTAIAEAQQKLKTMVERLQREYTATVTLVSDCARINSLLLKTVFERNLPGLVCYDSAGLTKRQGDAAFMNMRL